MRSVAHRRGRVEHASKEPLMSPRAVAPGLAALFLLLLSTGLAAPRNVSAWSHDPHQAVRVAAAPGNQVADAVLSDGAGGAFVFFEDSRSGNVDVYAQHVRWDGSLDPAWPPSGLPLCTATGDQTAIRVASDDAGGAYVCWLDNRSGVPKPYGTRVLPGGTIAAGFPANGQLLDTVTPAAQADGAPQICDSGTGLAALVWTSQVLATNNDIYGTTLYPTDYSSWCLGLVTTASNQSSPVIANEGGVFDLVWCEGGNAIDATRFSWGGSQFGSTQVLSNAAYVNTDPRIAPSGQGGAIVAWSAFNGAGYAPCASSFFGGIAWTNFGNIAPFLNANLYL